MDWSDIDWSAVAAKYSDYDINDLWMARQIIMDTRYAIVAMLALQIYEWIDSIAKEVKLIHRAKWTSIKIMYLLCRYYPFAVWILIIWAYVGDHDAQTCARVAHGVHATLAPCQFFSQAVMLMRAFGFAGRSRRVLAVLGLFYSALVGIDLWVFCTKLENIPPELFLLLGGTGCFPNYGSDVMGIRIGASMLAALVMDLVSLVIVVSHCLRSGWIRDVSLARYFVNQGLSAFAFISLINITTAITFFRPPRYHSGVGLPLILVVSNLIACRVILQLRAEVNPTKSELEQRHSCLVRNELFFGEQDSWAIEDRPP
ncbi:hypothetical protein BJ912DRAFT_944750 [Pholiota molesta]|nr:hypothetical protein BJ912DRAFT_944750 [Pholiota molesta]